MFSWRAVKPNKYDHDKLPCHVLGNLPYAYTTGRMPNPVDTSFVDEGKLYAHDIGLPVYGDKSGECFFKISELSKTDKELYGYVRDKYIIPEYTAPKH